LNNILYFALCLIINMYFDNHCQYWKSVLCVYVMWIINFQWIYIYIYIFIENLYIYGNPFFNNDINVIIKGYVSIFTVSTENVCTLYYIL